MFSFHTSSGNTNLDLYVFATSNWAISTSLKSSQGWEYISSRTSGEHILGMCCRALGSINTTTSNQTKPYLEEATLSTNTGLDDADSNSLVILTFLVHLYT